MLWLAFLHVPPCCRFLPWHAHRGRLILPRGPHQSDPDNWSRLGCPWPFALLPAGAYYSEESALARDDGPGNDHLLWGSRVCVHAFSVGTVKQTHWSTTGHWPINPINDNRIERRLGMSGDGMDGQQHRRLLAPMQQIEGLWCASSINIHYRFFTPDFLEISTYPICAVHRLKSQPRRHTVQSVEAPIDQYTPAERCILPGLQKCPLFGRWLINIAGATTYQNQIGG